MRRTSRRQDDDGLGREFQRVINMSPAEIRRWHRSPLSKLASLPHIRAELPLLADTKATAPSAWSPRMRNKAMRAVAFVRRHEAQMAVQGRRYGTGRLHVTEKRVVALLNWGRRTPGVALAKQLLREV